MSELKEFLKNPVAIATSFVLVLLLVKEIYGLIKWYKDRATDFHKKENEKEDLIKKVEEHDEVLNEIKALISGINERLDGIDKKMDEREMQRRKDIVITNRALLLQISDQIGAKQSITQSEYETFCEIADEYLEYGGNSVFKDKIIPRIKMLPISEK